MGKKNVKPFECEQPETETTLGNKIHLPHFKTQQESLFWLVFMYNLGIWHCTSTSYVHICKQATTILTACRATVTAKTSVNDPGGNG